MATLLCFGDSNTYGWEFATGGRFARDVRWTGRVAAALGAGWEVVEEGLNGRTTNVDDPEIPDANGLAYLGPCLRSHAPLDVVVLALGENDLKPHLERSVEEIARGAAALVDATRAAGVPRTLVLAPPPVPDPGARELPEAMRRAVEPLGAEFLDLGETVSFSEEDPWHFDAAGHAAVARAVLQALALPQAAVRELRVAVTAEDYDDALRFYRDALGLRELADFSSERGRVRLLDGGRATLELIDPDQAAFIDEVEVGRRVAPHIRIALEVDDASAVTARLAAAGAEVVAEPVRTPWESLNARLDAPAGLQLTLFEEPA